MRPIWIYTFPFADSRTILETQQAVACDDACLTTTVQDLRQHEKVWLLFANPDGELQTRLQRALQFSGRVRCWKIEYQQKQVLALIHYARSEAGCA